MSYCCYSEPCAIQNSKAARHGNLAPIFWQKVHIKCISLLEAGFFKLKLDFNFTDFYFMMKPFHYSMIIDYCFVELTQIQMNTNVQKCSISSVKSVLFGHKLTISASGIIINYLVTDLLVTKNS